MILWLALFVLVIAISFVLALQSMRDYQEIPQKPKEEYGLFLIRRLDNFNPVILESILKQVFAKNLIISIERLFKGNQTALTIFGSKTILQRFNNDLDFLELEDYALNLDSKDVSVWEMGVRDADKFNEDNLGDIFHNFPKLEDEDQFFWQVVVGKERAQIRAALYSKKPARRKVLAPVLQNLTLGTLIKVPKPFSIEQMMGFYRSRSLGKDSKAPDLDSAGVMRLLKFS